MAKSKSCINAKIIFFSVSCLGYLTSIIALLLTRGEAWPKILEENGYLYMGDFLMHVYFVSIPAKVYMVYEGCCFPPLAYLFYLFINRLLPSQGIANMSDYKLIPAGVLLYFAMVAFCMMIIALFIYESLEKRRGAAILACGLILFSEPFFAGAIERGNSVLLTLVLLLLALYCKEQKSAVLQELGLVLLAVAACLKLYPAVFGVLYLYEKRWKQALRLVCYGLFLFFVPFAFFGGYPGFLAFLHNLSDVGSKACPEIYTITGCVEWLYVHLADVAAVPRGVHLLGQLVSLLYLAVALFLAYRTGNGWKRMLYLSSLLIIFTNSSFPYTTIYLLLPFLAFIREKGDDHRILTCFYAVCFGLIFTTCTLPDTAFTAIFGKSFTFLLRYLVLYPMLLTALIESLCSLKGSHRS